ncbi:multiheme c-type cytochrome [Verrucomicrobiota bacterium sgz303538]
MFSPTLIIKLCVTGAFFLGCAFAFAQLKTDPGRFLGEQSCASSSCHGGGAGKDQCVIWQKKDVHSRTHAILGNARSKRIAESLGIPDATREARCTICHSPMESVVETRLAPGVKADKGVSCETCHGPAEKWLRFHARPDVGYEQRVAAGLREVRSLYGRSNACVACHLNIDAELVAAGHPEMFFELDGQTRNQPPHWKEEGAWLGPRTWFTGQATALRELSWKLASTPSDEDLVARCGALIWLLRQTPEGAKQLPAPGGSKTDFANVQSAADRLARIAARADWNRVQTMETLSRLAGTNGEFRDELQSQALFRRRAEVLVLAMDRLWQALKVNGETNDLLEKALQISATEARAQGGFSVPRFAAALQQAEVALERAIR